ncbi:MAG: hypothetical protein VCC00_07190 [Deltaproteobacteria bacterium]
MMRIWLKNFVLGGAVALLAVSLCVPAAFAFGDGTPDMSPPAEEIVCDDFGGRLWGICVAYCEAQDCPVSGHPSCDKLRDRFYDLSGTDIFPCDLGLGDLLGIG